MAIMNRNVNLEEINTDAFMGITFLSHQTLGQKICFVSSILCGIGITMANSFIWNWNPMIGLLLSMIPLLIGIAFGCNYNEDMTLIKYFFLIVSKPVKTYYSKPAEDLEQIHRKEDQLRMEEEDRKKKEREINDEAQKTLLKRLMIGVVSFLIVIMLAVVAITSLKTDEKHHEITIQTEAAS